LRPFVLRFVVAGEKAHQDVGIDANHRHGDIWSMGTVGWPSR
jgi:hypothetical protein